MNAMVSLSDTDNLIGNYIAQNASYEYEYEDEDGGGIPHAGGYRGGERGERGGVA